MEIINAVDCKDENCDCNIKQINIKKKPKNYYQEDPEFRKKHLARMLSKQYCPDCHKTFSYANQFRHNRSPKHIKNLKITKENEKINMANVLKAKLSKRIKEIDDIIKLLRALNDNPIEDNKVINELLVEKEQYQNGLKE